jgi:hypothetical protein
MVLLITFAAFFIAGQLTNVAIAAAVERIYEPAGLIVFFALFAVVVVASWWSAVRLTDRWMAKRA